MQIRYNVSGERRKAMVKVVSEALYGWTMEYLGVPSGVASNKAVN